MCVIGYKPHGVEPIDKETLKNCWKTNSHGAGYAWYDEEEKTWSARKGFMTWRHFWKAFKKQALTKEDCYIVHFRIKSAGAVTKGNTHPFPLVTNYTKMKKTKLDKVKTLVFHNGTCGQGDGSASDTMRYTKKFISPLMKREGKDMKFILSHILTETRDRWLITEGNSISRWGNWHDHEGCKYSNLIWKPYEKYTSVTPVYPRTKPAGFIPGASQNIQTGTGESRLSTCLMERTGELHPDGSVTWEADATTPLDEIISMCPHCYEDKNLTDSPFQNMGDTMCLRCGACFDDGTDLVIMHDHELLMAYDERQRAKKAGEL